MSVTRYVPQILRYSLICKQWCKQIHVLCSGCRCCKKRDMDELNTLPPNEQKEPSSLDHKPISIISQDHRFHSRNSPRFGRPACAAQNPPEYDDLPKFNWNVKDYKESRPTNWDSDGKCRSATQTSSTSLPDNEERHRSLPALGLCAKKREQAGLTCSLRSSGRSDLSGRAETPNKSGSDEREFTPTEHGFRMYNSDSSYQDGKTRVWENGRMRIKEPWEAPALSDCSKRSGARRLMSAGHDNAAFNQESTETAV